MAIGSLRAIAGMMKLQSGGTSTTLTSIMRALGVAEDADVQLGPLDVAAKT